ncbi:hypothetical protein H8959_014284 [Pygathrix nigripes]
MLPQLCLRRSASGAENQQDQREEAPQCLPPRSQGAWTRLPRRAIGACFSRCPRAPPAPPRRPQPRTASPDRGLCPPAAGSGGEPSAVVRPSQRKKCPPEETHKFYSGGPTARPGRKGRPGPKAASPSQTRELVRGKVNRAAGRCKGKPKPALPAKGSPPSWGAEWRRRLESRALRPAGGALGLCAPFGSRLGPAPRLRGAREIGRLRPRSQAHCSAGPGQGSKSGRRPSLGRRTPGESETSCRRFSFLFKNALGCAGGAFRPPGPAGDVRAAAAADAGLRAARSLQLVSSIVAERVSHFASPLAAAPLAGRRIAPHPAPRDPSRGRAPRAEHPAAARSRGRRGGAGDWLGNLRERRRVAGAAASVSGRAEERVDSGTRRGH